MVHGYHNQYLRVDVGARSTEIVELREGMLRRFLGGAGLGCAILLKERIAEVDALSPQSMLVFALSPLVGSPVTTSAKFAVVSKSPLTDRLNDSLASSGFAIAAKKAGYDAIAITGRAAELSVVVIDGPSTRIIPAPKLKGLSCQETEAALTQTYGNDFHAAVIGPAGERLVRYATISHAGRHAGRGGSGTVLGAKNIKAVIVRGRAACSWAEPTRLLDIAKTLSQRSLGPATAKYRELGTASNLLLFNRLNALPTRNFQAGSFAAAAEIAPETLEQTRERTRAYCVACTIGCEHMYQLDDTSDGETHVRLEYENLFALGSLCGISDAETVLRASRICDEYGIDTISAGGTIAFAMECAERGLLDAPWLRFGSNDALLRALEEIGRRDGLGNQLAEGSRRFADVVGQNSIAFAPQVKGLEIPGYEPRALQSMALGFAVGSRGADHNRSSAYEVDFSDQADRHAVSADSAHHAIATEDRATLMDSLIICKFLRGVFADFYSESAEILQAITGWDVSTSELRETAWRIATAKKYFNVRAGWQPQEDSLPARFFDAPAEESDAPRIDRAAFAAALQSYNTARGWSASGWLDESTSQQLLADLDSAPDSPSQ